MAGAWVIGHNIAGYLPESDTFAYANRRDAAEALAEEMRRYADEDDETTWEALPGNATDARAQGYAVNDEGEVDYGDDWPAMRATVDSVLADDGPDTCEAEWGCSIEDGSGRRIAFWLQWEASRLPDGYSEQWCDGDQDMTGDYHASQDATEYRVWTEDGTLVYAMVRTTDGWVLSGADGFDWVTLGPQVGPLADPQDFDLRLVS